MPRRTPPTLRPHALRRELHRLLGRLGLADDPDAPRDIAVAIAIRDGIPLRDALERLGIDTAPLDLPPPPQAIPFAHVAPGRAFSWRDHVWIRATLDRALAATPDRRAHPRVVAAYLAAVQRGHPATAFRWSDGAACLAEHVAADDLVYLAERPIDLATPAEPPRWTSTADAYPDLGLSVSIDTPPGPVTARLLLDDQAAGGAAWHTADGERLDLDEVTRWRSR